MIITKLIGGLGNQMFQYAVGRHLAMKGNEVFKLDISGFNHYKLRNYDLDSFNIQENFATSEDLSRVLLPSDGCVHKIRKYLSMNHAGIPLILYIKERNFNFNPEILTFRGDIYLDGYWQTEKYFSEVKDVIKNEFTLKNKPDPINDYYLGEIRDCESISIHIRRGDYISNPRVAQIHGFLGIEYYKKALSIMLENTDNPHFFVFSDDPEWTEKNLKTDLPMTHIKHNGSKGYEDLRLMSACKYHIIANSSFSWWGAWLSPEKGKIVIAPRRWFKSDKLNTNDLIPKSWCQI